MLSISEQELLDLSYDASAISLTKTPNQAEYEYNTAVLVEATPYPGYVLYLTGTGWSSNTITMDEVSHFRLLLIQILMIMMGMD